MEEVQKLFEQAVQAAVGEATEVILTVPDEQFGDYATNVALQLSKKVGQNPRELAEAVVAALPDNDVIAETSIAGPGFINIKLTDQALWQLANETQPPTSQRFADKSVVAEYSDPNPFKVLHAGHIYTTVVGDGIATLMEAAGATVHRVNFGGDVGMHVAKTMWVILQKLGGEHPEKLADIPDNERSEWLAACYVEGNNTYETDEAVRAEMVALNKRVYALHKDDELDSPFAQIYWTCRDWSYQAFDDFYARMGTNMEKYYPESEVADLGTETVRTQLKKGVFEESEGAIVFPGDKHDLHTRVFINSEGLPTYEAKDIGLILQKYQDYHFDISVVVTDNEQQQYMAVILKAVEQFAPELAAATLYIPHGKVKLAGGIKMSSRKGNIIRAVEVLKVTEAAIRDAGREPNNDVVTAAIKYAFLKYRIGGDVIYDPAESVSLQGNSGPYLQYAHARARSILSKAQTKPAAIEALEADERSLVRKLSEYQGVVELATNELMPHHICTYLYELSQVFNRFYEHNRVIGHEREAQRLALVERYADALKAGLTLLNIPAPERM